MRKQMFNHINFSNLWPSLWDQRDYKWKTYKIQSLTSQISKDGNP